MAFQHEPLIDQKIPAEYKVIVTSSLLTDTPYGQQNSISGSASVSGGSPTLEAVLPENYELNVNSDYSPAFPNGIASFVENKSGAVAQGLRLLGYNMQSQDMTLQVWQGSAPIDFSIPFIFIAHNDAYREITLPIAALHALVMPTALGGAGGVFKSPGPTVKFKKESVESISAAATSFKNLARGAVFHSFLSITGKTSVMIGNHLYFPNVIITGVTSNFETKFTKAGQPIMGSVNVAFRTLFTPTAQDMNTVFKIGTPPKDNFS